MAVEGLAADRFQPLSRLPRGQPDLRVHAVEHADPERVWLAEALLPARDRGVRAHIQGADGGDCLGGVRDRRNPKCDNCMAHCGYEGTAVNDALAHPLKAMKVALRGPRTDGPLAPELPIRYTRESASVPLTALQRSTARGALEESLRKSS